jgi:hypothetical protein
MGGGAYNFCVGKISMPMTTYQEKQGDYQKIDLLEIHKSTVNQACETSGIC